MPFPLTSNIIISTEVLAQKVEDETVLLDLRSESYFGLDKVGSRIWLLLQEHSELQKVFDIMLDEYDVDSNQLENDLNKLIENLLDAKLITATA